MTIESLIGDYQTFFSDLLHRMKKVNIIANPLLSRLIMTRRRNFMISH